MGGGIQIPAAIKGGYGALSKPNGVLRSFYGTSGGSGGASSRQLAASCTSSHSCLGFGALGSYCGTSGGVYRQLAASSTPSHSSCLGFFAFGASDGQASDGIRWSGVRLGGKGNSRCGEARHITPRTTRRGDTPCPLNPTLRSRLQAVAPVVDLDRFMRARDVMRGPPRAADERLQAMKNAVRESDPVLGEQWADNFAQRLHELLTSLFSDDASPAKLLKAVESHQRATEKAVDDLFKQKHTGSPLLLTKTSHHVCYLTFQRLSFTHPLPPCRLCDAPVVRDSQVENG